MAGPRDLPEATLADLQRRIAAAAAALPARPRAALRELRAAQEELSAHLGEEGRAGTAPPVTGDVRLTARERQVLGLLVRGDRNKEIALRLGLRERTVKFHVANVLAKLGAHSRTEAVRRALELGPAGADSTVAQ